jgi:hypothetical protein
MFYEPAKLFAGSWIPLQQSVLGPSISTFFYFYYSIGIFLLDEGLLASLSDSRPIVTYSELASVVHLWLPKIPDFAEQIVVAFLC